MSIVMLDKIETPFGDFHVKVNGDIVPFPCETKTDNGIDDDFVVPITVHVIEFDVSNLKVDDYISCGFDNEMFNDSAADEFVALALYDSETTLLGLASHEPRDWEVDEYCYRLEDGDGGAFYYRIASNPDDYDEWYAKTLRIAVSWINKADYKDPLEDLPWAMSYMVA